MGISAVASYGVEQGNEIKQLVKNGAKEELFMALNALPPDLYDGGVDAITRVCLEQEKFSLAIKMAGVGYCMTHSSKLRKDLVCDVIESILTPVPGSPRCRKMHEAAMLIDQLLYTIFETAPGRTVFFKEAITKLVHNFASPNSPEGEIDGCKNIDWVLHRLAIARTRVARRGG
ncbi:MAG: hypothetical protein JSR76_07185 [Verrucomicrobia bacterium]|nr:hypothetical protein [Verrucomicrobiota bacterium]